jgi:branched-chain amino acid transport system ATP-binding protein
MTAPGAEVPPARAGGSPREQALSAESLKVRYRNGALGVVDVSLRVEVGQVVALFGPNGAGKTTTVNAIGGFLRSEGARVVGGSVTVFGADVTNKEPHVVHRLGVATVPERKKVFPALTVSENLRALGRLPSRRRRKGVYDRVYELFPGLAAKRSDLAGRLSGGQQQMLAIARTLVCEPKILIIDELTLGLHHSLHEPLFEVVSRIAAEGTAVMLVDESTGFALEAAEHCYRLGAGVVKDSGPSVRFRGSELLAAGYVEGD